MVKYSIIIPVYNVSKYLSICVKSVLEQINSEIEIILVDDGSTDGSGKICDDLSSLYKNIIVIHKSNGGLSSARNTGVKVAKGDYIGFLDSDDYWNCKTALSDISALIAAEKPDVIVFPMIKKEENREIVISKMHLEDYDNNKNFEKRLECLVKHNVFRASACNKFVRKEFFDNYELVFREGYLNEDIDYCGKILEHLASISYYDNPFYIYRQERNGSITNDRNYKLVSDRTFMCDLGLKQLADITDEFRKNIVGSYYAYEYSVLLGVSYKFSKGELADEIKNLKVLLKFDLCKKVKKVNTMMNCLGYKLTKKILGYYVLHK